jgi:cellulose synthase operon protein C
LKCFRNSAANSLSSTRMRRWIFGAFVFAIVGSLAAMGELPSWIRNIESASAIEAAFFRMMSLPGGAVPFRRPPGETRPALGELIKNQPHNAELYSLRALEGEQQLDFTAAESDWKAYVTNASNKTNVQLALADFYHRRLRPSDEIKTLSLAATAAPLASEKLTAVSQQQSWRAFDRIFGIIDDQGLSKEVSIAQYRAWIARYPQESSLYARFLQFLVAQKEYTAASQLIASYSKQFPADQVFPVKAKAMVDYRQGSVREGLAVYEQSFQPLWDPELVKSYFDLLRETQNVRKFLDQARAAISANPEDLNAMARVFYYYQQQGKLEAAQQAIAEFRSHKESSKSPWTSRDLYICARLLEEIHSYPESARYYFALYNSKGSDNAQAQALAGLSDILLTAPETPIRFGSSELSMYRDIATMDQGPGYLNGILSLILNTTEPASHYSEEELRAVPYFHRSRAAELIALLDTRFPNSPERPELHAKLLEYYAGLGESDAVIQGGREFLSAFPSASQRTSVALLMADAYARKNDTNSEFAIYDSVLKELAANAQGVPIGKSAAALGDTQYQNASQESEVGDEEGESEPPQSNRPARSNSAFEIGSTAPAEAQTGPRSPEYSRVLERYLGRLVEKKQIPRALSVLSGEIDRNPDDPGLYERLAVFLDQNRLGEEQEQVYRRAMARFSDRSWYDKLARFYLRYRRNTEFAQLTRDAIKSFTGTDLEHYFQGVYGTPQLYLQLNLYAHQRFPHNPVFVENLLRAYQSRETYDQAAWEALLRQHWFEETNLRNLFFAYLSSNNRLETELSALRQTAPDENAWRSNPAAADFIASANLWQSHFEESAAPLKLLAEQYPAEREIADTTSSVYRSLAYFDPGATAVAAKIQDNLLQANPRDTEILARIGDIYSDREQFAQAAPYWERIPRVAPGQQSGYLEAATIYWDYFDFDNAMRLLNQGRDRLHNGNLYAYEAGAIYENKRDYPHAIDEYVRGALDSPGSSAESRLLQLARRPKLRDFVEQSTARIATGANLSMPAINLRIAVLEAQNRKPEMESFLDSAISGAATIEQAEDIENLAQQKSLESVRQHALEKQIALTTDPVTRLQLRYSLIRLYEAHKDSTSAERNIEALYRENPKILGVVRSTVDFYWRTKNYPKAIAIVTQAANDSYPELAKQFSYEAARKSTDAKRYQQAREFLSKLLEADPYNSEYLAAMADTYAREGDDRGLQQFYSAKIALFRTASLPPDTRKAQIATLRRGLIPALTRMKDYSGAVDQYIELIINFPEDQALVTEAALYAQRYQRAQQLTGFYAKTVAASPRDFRWPMVLARVQTNLEDYPAAITTYGKAITVRPDRSDLFIGRAELETRLMRFDDAAADYERLYQLNYKDPQWMEKVAETRARQAKATETVAALKIALIDGRPENANNYFEVARRLESWGMLAEARSFAEQGTKSAGADLLANGEYLAGAKTYVRIMTRLRQYDKAYDRMSTALGDAASQFNIVEQQVARQGVVAITDQQWRARTRQTRIETASSGMNATMQELGSAANAYFTPEERQNLAAFAEAKRKGMDLSSVESFLIPLAQTAALADQEAHWRFEVMMSQAHPNGRYYAQMEALIDLQRRRGRFSELAGQMEQLAAALPKYPSGLPQAPLLAAADAYRSAADAPNEYRLLRSAFTLNWAMDRTHEERYFRMLLERDPDELVRITGMSNSVADRAVSLILSDGTPALAHAAVHVRARIRPPVWSRSYNALVGLYFSERTPEVNNAFVGALGDATIGQRLSSRVDRAQQLAGGIWFYYGSRYGEYLGNTKQPGAEDFLPAALEESPATAANYLTLADYYMGAGDTKRAIEEYEHTRDLAPSRADVYDDLALAYYKQGERAAALAQWKLALAQLLKDINRAQVPETFWQDFGRTCDQLRTRHLFAELKPDAETVVRTYLHHNGSWRSNAVLQPAYLAVADPAAATQWLISLSSSATNPAQILGDVADANWIPLAQRAPIYQRVLDLKTAATAGLAGAERDSAQQELVDWQVRWITYLVKTKQYSQAADAIAALPAETRAAQAATLVPLDLRIAAQLGTLDAKIAQYRAIPDDVPQSGLLRTAARQIFDAGDKQSARKILEFVFGREIDEHQLVASNFLGLAEIRIASGDTPGALDLLRRLVAVVGNPFENLDPAPALLEKTGHNAEAIEFLDQLVKSSPWDASYQLRLAKAKIAAGQDTASAEAALSTIASAVNHAYGLRSQAALVLPGKTHSDLGSGELNFLAEKAGAAANLADKFYFYEARIKAAQSVPDPQLKVQLLSHCIVDFPRRDEARLPLFQSAISTRQDEMALTVIQPVFHQFTGGYTSVSAEEQIIGGDENTDASEDDNQTPVLSSTKLSRLQQIEVAQTLGEIMLRLKRPNEALPYFQTARRLETAPANRRVLDKKIADLKGLIRIQQQNAARQPVLHDALDQDRIVRPRLIARAATAQVSNKGGANQ